MERSIAHLPALSAPTGEPMLRPHLLTGARFWYQTAYCLQSLALHSRRGLAPVIHDDGSLRLEHCRELSRLFPAARFVGPAETLSRLENLLPASRFPALRERWNAYPHIRKLIDIHLGSEGWKLVLDSDLLFHRRPELLIAWNDAPGQPLIATDCVENYGYTRTLMTRLCGHAPGDRVNVGICGLRSQDIDWERLEHWTSTLIQEEATSYYLEQALTAMLVAGRDCMQAPSQDYLTLPSRQEALKPTAAMHHYVDLSKRWYFTECWRGILEKSRTQASTHTPHRPPRRPEHV